MWSLRWAWLIVCGLLLPVQEQQGLGRCVPCLAATALSLHSGANAIDLSVHFWWQRHWPLFAFSGANAIALSVHFGAHACAHPPVRM